MKILPEKMKWCEHIHNWGNAFYFVGTHNPFAVLGSEVWGQNTWTTCPICGKGAPRITKDKEAGK